MRDRSFCVLYLRRKCMLCIRGLRKKISQTTFCSKAAPSLINFIIRKAKATVLATQHRHRLKCFRPGQGRVAAPGTDRNKRLQKDNHPLHEWETNARKIEFFHPCYRSDYAYCNFVTVFCHARVRSWYDKHDNDRKLWWLGRAARCWRTRLKIMTLESGFIRLGNCCPNFALTII